MIILQINVFKFTGLQNFGPIQEKLFILIGKAFGYCNYEYQQAIEEAVCNAARYSIAGPAKADITVKIRRMAYDIAVSVYAKTIKFDAKSYQKKLQSLLNDPKVAAMDWGDYVGVSFGSSGFWYMLTGCEYIYVDSQGQGVTLVARTDRTKLVAKTTNIGQLVPRFMVKQNGVIE